MKAIKLPFPRVRRVLAWILIAYLCLTLEHRYLYHPDNQNPLEMLGGAPAGTALQEVSIPTSDGETLNAWYVPPQKSRETIVHFHGNGGNLAHRAGIYTAFIQQGYGLLAISPRGYGVSTGTPCEKGFYQDLRAASAYLTQKKSIPPKQQIAVGESLGTGVVIDAATDIPFRAVVVYSGFTSTPEVFRHLRETWQVGIFSPLPLEYIIQQPYNSIAKINQVHSPLLIVHGDQDEMMPVSMGQALFDKAPTLHKKMLLIKGAGHNEVFPMGQKQILKALDELLQSSESKSTKLITQE